MCAYQCHQWKMQVSNAKVKVANKSFPISRESYCQRKRYERERERITYNS